METLNYIQRAALLAAQERRMKAAKLARIQRAIVAAQAPDYFTAMGRTPREPDSALRALVRDRCRFALRAGCDPRNLPDSCRWLQP